MELLVEDPGKYEKEKDPSPQQGSTESWVGSV